MPALICTISQVELLLTDDGSWLVRKNEHEADTEALRAQAALFWLPLLEQDYPAFRQQILAGLKPCSTNPPSVFASFPLQPFLLLGLMSQSSYWIERAVNWASFVAIDAEVKQQLLAVSIDKAISQRARHQAKRIFFVGQVK
jgi:hypothetical protein